MRETDDGKLLLRNSERQTFLRCRLKWKWLWLDGRAPRVAAPALRFGTLIHEALAAYYKPGRKRGPQPAKTFGKLYELELKEASRFGFRDEDGDWHDALELGLDMLDGYTDEYGDDSHIEVIAPEQPFAVDLPTRDGHKYLVTPVGTFDAIIRDLRIGKVGLFEHKTAASISLGHLPLDEQAGTYHALAGDWLIDQGILKPGEQIDFILYNFLRKALRDERPRNPDGQYLNKPQKADLQRACADHNIVPGGKMDDMKVQLEKAKVDWEQYGAISKNQPPAYFARETVYRDEADREQLLFRIRAQAWEMSEAEAGRLPIYKRPTMGCAGGMGESKCPVYDACELHETGSDWEETLNLTMIDWDPYESPYERSLPQGI